MSVLRSVAANVGHPLRWLRDVCGGQPVFPLVVLFGLNAVDELDRAAFGILLPEIRDDFGLDLRTTLGLVAAVSVAALALQVPIAQLADRSPRVPIMVAGAVTWALFAGLTGLATGLVVLGVARSGSSLGKAVIDPTHNSLIADYYPISSRNRVYSVHRAANAVGAFAGPLAAGLLAFRFGWRLPFLVFVVPTIVFAVMALRLREPVRGRWERAAAGASADVIGTEEAVPSFAESWRTVQRIPTLRRLWASLPFLAASLIGFVALAALLYEQEFDLDERARGVAAAIAEPFQLVGLVIGARVASRRYLSDPAGLIAFLGKVALAVAGASALFAMAPNIVVAVAINCLISAMLAILAPGLLATLSLVIPPRARATGFSVASLWVIPGLLLLPLIGWIADHWSIRAGMLAMVPSFVVGSIVLWRVADIVTDDIAAVWQGAAARAEAIYERRQGRSALLLVRSVDAGYDGRTVLRRIDLDVAEGEIVALLGTNGAGKSTLLKSISGVVEADRGAIVLDGRDITHTPPDEIAALGVVQLPGGAGVFGELTVDENLQLGEWNRRRRRDSACAGRSRAEVLEMFPILARRLDEKASNLSGGQQQMLALGMCLLTRPRVLLVDEVSLGLAPIVVEQLLPVLRGLADEGVAVVLVEQSVNVALEVAERAYFLERGEIRFAGTTAELLERPDLLRSVFLAAAADVPAAAGVGDRAAPDGAAPVLAVADLSVSFGGVRAVDGVSFDVAPAEIVGVIGANGAGKTTVFDLVSGFTAADSGSVRLAGRDLGSAGARRRALAGLGRSFQNARLFPELTVSENIDLAQQRWLRGAGLAATALGLPVAIETEHRIEMRSSELVELFGLGDDRHHRVRELSTGTRRVVDLACIVAHRPLVVLLDEPTAGIAQREVEALVPVVRRLRDEMGAALVVIDHDLPFLSSIADRLIAMDQGTLIAAGDPASVITDADVIAAYLGTTPAAIARSGSRRDRA